MDFLDKMEKEYKKQTEAIRASYEKIIYAHFEDMKVAEKLDQYNWQDSVDQLLEGSMGEASEEDCKKEILKNYTDYLNKEDEKLFNQNWIKDIGEKYIREEIL